MVETRLTRDLDEAMLGGVLAGLAARYDWDVTLVRIVAVLLTVTTLGVPGVVIYLAAWVIVPPASEVGASSSDAQAGVGGGAADAESVVDEMAAVVREAAERVEEAGRIAAEAVRAAAEEIGEVVRRPRTGGDAGTSEGGVESGGGVTEGSEASGEASADASGEGKPE